MMRGHVRLTRSGNRRLQNLSLSCRDFHESIHTLPTWQTGVTTFINPTVVNCGHSSQSRLAPPCNKFRWSGKWKSRRFALGELGWYNNICVHLGAFPRRGPTEQNSALRHPVQSCRIHPANCCAPGRRQGRITLGIIWRCRMHTHCESSLNIAWRWGGRVRHQICLGIRTYLNFLLGFLPTPAPVGPLFPTSELAPLPEEHKGDG